MAPMKAMKSMKAGAKAMSKGAFLKAIAEEHGLMRHKPGTVKMPVFFTSFEAMSTRLLNTLEQSLCFKPCSSAIAFKNAPLLMAFAPAFMAFIAFIGAMLLHGEDEAVR